MKENWNKIRDLCHSCKLFIGFKFLGWHKPVEYEWAYFVDPLTVVKKYRDENRVVHTFMQTFSNKGVKYDE